MFIAFILAFLFAFSVSGIACRRIRRRPILDDAASESHKTHQGAMPTGGGIGIWLGIIVPFLAATLGLWVLGQVPAFREKLPESIDIHLGGLRLRSVQLWSLLGLGSLLVLLGWLDDRYKLHWKFRLSVQTVTAAAAVLLGFRLTGFVDWPLLTGLLSVLWIVGLTNSFNMLDNMDGLSAGVAVICAAFLAAVMLLAPNRTGPQLFIIGFLLVLIGALLGFMLHNNPFRCRLFMGDSGAYLIGFLLGSITLVATFTGYENGQRPQTVFVPVLILAVPLYDTFSVILIRLLAGRSPFAADRNHYSHRLTELGLSRRNAVLTIYLTTAICCFGALLLYQVDLFGATIVVIQTLLVLFLIAILESHRPRKPGE